ncbi:hypothetical protein BGZ61DRAFT_483938 [Ilyonectria robusta]|uniref:uncharacterized protein n=1 Tax=Ilyonectria robusta TaxID=1079257 RepID=UPI001E8CC952|nr:uncharacterized protein BGZ61DRAFT_483938 [Ilyonectria robusta]KAH8667253.1 hypothetical protein BGZ61DRAFT_483938 [Ilyonectria robusta]
MLRILIPFIALWVEASLGSLNLELEQTPKWSMADMTKAKAGEPLSFGSAINLSSIQTLEGRGLFALEKRECLNTGYYVCEDGARCCPNGDTCVALGCCEGTSEQCGTRKCYDSSSQTCCGSESDIDSLVCGDGQVCQPGGCCDSGYKQCGSQGCYAPDTQVCCAAYNTHCPKGYDCVTGGDCCKSGLVPCGDTKCYDPDTQTCCGNGAGACQKGTTCCGSKCCKDIAYCGSNDICSACPDETKTVTSTQTTTDVVVKTNTITEVPKDEPTGFSCVPITVTNTDEETLILGTDCGLTYEPPSTTSTDDGSLRLRARQINCKAPATRTTTVIVTKGVTTRTTTTITTTKAASELGFSCPPMEATNDAGDVLALDEDCSMSLSFAEPTTTSESQRTVTVQGGGGSASTSEAGGDSAASPMGGPFVSAGTLAIIWVAGFIAQGI